MEGQVMWVRLLVLYFLVVNYLRGTLGAAPGPEAVNSTASCAFPFGRFRESVEKIECTKSLGGGEMVQCLTFLLAQTNRPTEQCCAAAMETWSRHPECLCKLAFYLPGSDIFSSFTGPKLLQYCVLTADLCSQCPSLLGLAPDPVERKSRGERSLVVPVAMVCFVAVVAVAAVVVMFIFWRRRVLFFRRTIPDRDEILRIESDLGKPILFAFRVLKVATNDFNSRNKLGQGGFGVVYKGILYDGSEVAVKKLSTKSKQGKEEFLNEISLITKVQHKNLVKLRGCCLMGQERLLVYEYLENKSLHDALFNPGKKLDLDWPTRVNILVGTARGLAYLHEGCQTRIVHRDIKSSNILLDKDRNAKIADFGLARLFSEDQSHVSTRVAGTVGYLSPEYAMRGQLSEKADVFSFGIVALELVSGRTNFNIHLSTDQAYLLDWTWTLHENGNVLDILDPVLVVEAAKSEEVVRVIEIALLCTQSVASMRPSMTKVVSMLVGQAQVETKSVVKPTFRVFSSTSMSRGVSMERNPARNVTSRNDASIITVEHDSSL